MSESSAPTPSTAAADPSAAPTPSLHPRSFDAIVVGGGPAGSSTALFLARAGRNVLLLEKAKFPRDKVCGDAVSGKSVGVLRELGLLPALNRPAAGIIRGVTLVAPNDKAVTVPFRPATGLEFAGYTLPRLQTDAILFEAVRAEKNITLMEDFTVKSLHRDATGAVDGVEGEPKSSPGALVRIHARVVVGADGAASIVARQLALPPVPPPHNFMAIRGYWEGVEGLTDNIELWFIDGVLPGYFWIFPMGEGRCNVGLGILASDVKARNVHPNKLLEEAISKHKALAPRFSNSKRLAPIGAWTIPCGSHVRRNYGEGWALVGDAASLVDPFSGEGFGNATSSGKFAAQTIHAALADGGTSPLTATQLKPYSDLVDKELRPEMDVHYKLQQACRMRFLLNHFIGKAATKPEFRQVIIDMLASDEEKEKKVTDPLFYLKVLLP